MCVCVYIHKFPVCVRVFANKSHSHSEISFGLFYLLLSMGSSLVCECVYRETEEGGNIILLKHQGITLQTSFVNRVTNHEDLQATACKNSSLITVL